MQYRLVLPSVARERSGRKEVDAQADEAHVREPSRRLETARRQRAWVFAIAAAFAMAYGAASAQDHGAAVQRPLFRSSVDLVTLHVSVTDRKGKYLTDIAPGELLVLEEGRRQQLSFFERGGLPLAVGVILDTSSSVRHAFSDVKEAAVRFLRQLRSVDRAAVLAFGDSV